MTSTLDDARGELLTQAIAAADGIDLLQDSRHLRRRTAEILRELVALTRAAPVPQCDAEPVAWQATDPGLNQNAILTPDRSVADIWRKAGLTVRPLYATPPSRSDAVNATPSTLCGMITAIYGNLDAEDCAMVDREWAKMRGYILPTDGTSTLSSADRGTP